MINPDSLKRSVHYWVKALSRVGQGVSELRVPANTMIELTDDFFEDTSPSQNTEWFQIDGERFEVYLDDDTSTLRLANRLVMDDLHGSKDYPLVTWFGHRVDAYQLTAHRDDDNSTDGPDDASHPDERPSEDVVWIGWNHALWKTYLFDGVSLVPVTRAGVATAGLDVDADRVVWMGWDGENLDVFTSGFSHLPTGLCVLCVSVDGTVLEVGRRQG